MKTNPRMTGKNKSNNHNYEHNVHNVLSFMYASCASMTLLQEHNHYFRSNEGKKSSADAFASF